jgi:hypothetical protein
MTGENLVVLQQELQHPLPGFQTSAARTVINQLSGKHLHRLVVVGSTPATGYILKELKKLLGPTAATRHGQLAGCYNLRQLVDGSGNFTGCNRHRISPLKRFTAKCEEGAESYL